METDNLRLDTFPKLLRHHASVRPNKPAIREKSKGIWQTKSWKEFSGLVDDLAGGLAAQGFTRGDHVVLVGDNKPRLYVAMCATQLLGGVAVPLYQDAASAEMALPIQNAEATHVFVQNQEQVDKILEILPQCPTVKHLIYDEERGLRHYAQPQIGSFDEMLEKGKSFNAGHSGLLDAELALGKGSDAASMFFTSGTTGVAKGVVLTHDSLIDRARAAAEMEHLTDSDSAIAYLPPAWIGQNIFSYAQPMVVGYCICCPESSETMLADMREIGPTYFFAPPRVLEALVTQVSIRMEDAGQLKRGVYERCMKLAQRVGPRMLSNEIVSAGDRLAYWLSDLAVFGPLRDVLGMSRVRVAYTAGEAVSPDLMVFFRSIGINLKQLYGSTETSVFVCIQPDGQVKNDTVGMPLKGVELKFTAARELLVRSPGLFKEYHKNPQATEEARDADGWFRTGDAGYVGDDGHLRIIDRVKDVGTLDDGTMFAPKYIENKLKFFPYIKEAVAFGQGRGRVCVFVNIDMDAVGNWADRNNISYTGHTDLASRDEIYELIGQCIEQANAGLALEPALANSQIGRFLLLHKELDADDGELTRTRKVRRGFIGERYQTLLDAMYAGDSSVMVNAEVRYEDGRVATVSAEVKIRDAKKFPAAPQLKAA
jgi:long-chain acyl-CoA synthetase